MKQPLLTMLGIISLLSVSCGSDCDEPASGVSASIARRVMPAVTDTMITSFADNPHMAFFNAAITPQNKLVVYLPDHGRLPLETADFGGYAALQGYHVVSLNYVNSTAFIPQAAVSADADSFAKARREMLTGEDVSALVAVSRAESLQNRLVKLLQHLDAKYPGEDWGRYLNSGIPDSSAIIVCGSGQGATNAAMFAREYKVDKAVCFSLSEDKLQNNTIAGWMSTSSWATATEDVIGVALPENRAVQQQLWEFMQLHGDVAHIDEDAGVVRANKYVFNEAVPVLVYDHVHDLAPGRDRLWHNVLAD